jgi:NOL1/NOP2/fmu family ribosome biogenesis protein
VSRFGAGFTTNKVVLTEEQCQTWLRGEDLLDIISIEQKGKTAIVCIPSGLVLGRGKYLKDRLKNLLPRRLI